MQLAFASPTRSPIDAADAGDQSVRRGVLDQILDRAATALRRDHQRAVFDEGAGIAQVVNILARSALMGFAAARDRLGPRIIEAVRMPLLHFLQVVANVIEIDCLRIPRLCDADISLLDESQRMAFKYRIPFVHRDLRARYR